MKTSKCRAYSKEVSCLRYSKLSSNSLLPIVGKLLEKCVHTRVVNHISECTTNFLQVLHDIGNRLDGAEQTDIVYLDYAKAFDEVNNLLLQKKINGFGIAGNLLLRFENYLSDAHQRVTIPGSTSEALPALSFVPWVINVPYFYQWLTWYNYRKFELKSSFVCGCLQDLQIS